MGSEAPHGPETGCNAHGKANEGYTGVELGAGG